MNPARYMRAPSSTATPNPPTDAGVGVPVYTDDITILVTNPPDLLLAPSSRVSHVEQLGRPGLGPGNEQLFQSGSTNIVVDNPADEQGVGRSPGFQWAHYPHVQQFNPTITHEAYLQDGGGFHAFSERVQRQPIWPEGYLNLRQNVNQHQWWPHVATVNQPETPAFVETVPAIY